MTLPERDTRVGTERQSDVEHWAQEQVILRLHDSSAAGHTIDEAIDHVRAMCEEAIPVLDQMKAHRWSPGWAFIRDSEESLNEEEDEAEDV